MRSSVLAFTDPALEDNSARGGGVHLSPKVLNEGPSVWGRVKPPRGTAGREGHHKRGSSLPPVTRTLYRSR